MMMYALVCLITAEGDVRGNRCMPSGFNEIAPYWSDLCADTTAGRGRRRSVVYSTQGVAPNRVFIVQYAEMHFWTPWEWDPAATFQVQLFEGTNDIVVKYLDVRPKAQAMGQRVTTGISSNYGGTGVYVMHGCGAVNLRTGLAVRYTPEYSTDDPDCGIRSYRKTFDDQAALIGTATYGSFGRLPEQGAPSTVDLLTPVGDVQMSDPALSGTSGGVYQVKFQWAEPDVTNGAPAYFRVAVTSDPSWPM